MFSDLALDALGTTIVGALSAGTDAAYAIYDTPATLGVLGGAEGIHGLAHGFLTDDIDRCFRYFVTRDINDFIGTDALPTIAAAQSLADDVATHCRRIAAGVALDAHESRLREAAAETQTDRRLAVVRNVFAGSLNGSLALISGDAASGNSR
jgi:hypothetical protein